MTPQQKLANRIYELLPQKKELEFGCKVRTYIDGVQTITHRHKIGNVKECWGTTTGAHGSLVNDEDIKEIIGQPLRLADVLMAIQKSPKQLNYYYVDVNGRIDNPKESAGYYYNLEKDNILDESDEFCEFVYELIK